MAYEKSEFTTEYEGLLKAHAKRFPYTRKPTDVAWKIYENASKASLGFHLFGRRVAEQKVNKYRKTHPGTKDAKATLPGHLVGLSKAEGFYSNFLELHQGKGATGSVLNTHTWSMFVNDAWLVGGMHAGLPFYAASPLEKSVLLDASHVVTVTGRELVGLCTFGYSVRQGHPSLGTVMVCDNEDIANAATLEGVYNTVAGCKTAKDVTHILAQGGLTL